MTVTRNDTATDRRATTEDPAFEDLILAFSRRIPCQMTSGGRCQRGAQWRLDVHGCEEMLICTEHLHAWESHVLRVIWHGGATICGLCAERFPSLETVRQVIAL